MASSLFRQYGTLFRQYNIFDVIESRKIDLKDEIKRMPASALQGDVHEIANSSLRGIC